MRGGERRRTAFTHAREQNAPVVREEGESCRLTDAFFFNDTATTEIYTLSLHDALPIWFPVLTLPGGSRRGGTTTTRPVELGPLRASTRIDRKSPRLNSSHGSISDA